jgi:hypothetical protein
MATDLLTRTRSTSSDGANKKIASTASLASTRSKGAVGMKRATHWRLRSKRKRRLPFNRQTDLHTVKRLPPVYRDQ